MRTPSALPFTLPLLLSALLLGALAIAAGPLAPAAGAVSFAPYVDYEVGDFPLGVAIGDFDGDGDPDLAVGNDESATVSVLLGVGDGTFGAGTGIGTGSGPQSVAVGDFDNDGHQDLATANWGPSTVTVLLGDGTGAFTTASSPATGLHPTSVAVGDFDNDGHQDLAVADYGPSTVTVLLGDGGGNFTATASSPATGSGPRSVAVGDFDNDGHQDLTTADSGPSTVTVLLGDGGGNFTASASSPATGSTPQGVAVGDFDGNGDQDLAVADFGSDSVSIILGNGDGSFAAKADFGSGYGPASVAVGDFDRDGKQDLAVPQGGDFAVSVLLGVREAPSGSMELSGGAAVTATRAVTVDAGVAEATEMRVRNEGGEWSAWSTYLHKDPWTLSEGDGVKTVEAEYRNALGTIARSDSIVLDTDAPGPVVRVHGWRYGWQQRCQMLRFSAAPSEGGAAVDHIEYRLDGGVWKTGVSVRITRQGVTRVQCRAVDVFGTIGAARTCTVRYDSKRPRVVARRAHATAGSIVRVRYKVKDVIPGCGRAKVRVVIKNAAGTMVTRAATRPVTTNAWHGVRVKALNLTPGTYRLMLRATDRAGNVQRHWTATMLTVR